MKKHTNFLVIATLAAVALAAIACGSSGSSPTAAFKAIYDAVKSKDVAGFKKNLASSDLKEMEEGIKSSGKTIDQFLKEMLDSPDNLPPALETRNEKIDGDKATLESKKKNGDWETINFVKEGGDWKVKMK